MGKYDLVNSNIGNEQELFSIFEKSKIFTLLDIGANDGLSSVRYAKLFPNAMIHAFEPIPGNVQKMRENFMEFGVSDRILIHPLALSDKSGVFDFYLSSGQPPGINDGYDYGDKSSSLLEPYLHLQKTPWCLFTKSSIKTFRFDELPNKPTTTDFIHIDVQGAELKVLEGFGKELNKVKAIWMEVERIPLYSSQPLYNDVKAFMEKNHFKLIKDNVNDVTGDQFWVRN